MALIMSTSINKESNISTKHKKLGDLLVHTGLINHKVLEKALEIQKTQKRKIGQILIEMGVVDDMQIAKALANQLKVPLVRLNNVEIPEKIISLVPQYLAETYTLIPVKQVKNKLVVAMVNPLEFNALDDLRFCTQMPVFVTVAPQSDILDAIGRYYQQNLDIVLGTDYDFTEHVEIINQAKEIDHNVQELIKLTELPQMVRFTNTILSDAVKLKASDIHIEPQKDNMIIRYKVDGVMQEIMQTNKQVHLTLVTRIKIMSGLNISNNTNNLWRKSNYPDSESQCRRPEDRESWIFGKKFKTFPGCDYKTSWNDLGYGPYRQRKIIYIVYHTQKTEYSQC